MDLTPTQDKIYAIIGVSQNPEKYGHRVFKDLIASGYSAFPVNPNEKEILGHKVYATLKEIPKKIDIAVFVVPASVSLQVLKDVNDLNIENAWFQPGSESPEVVDFCKEHNINYITDACIMIERKKNE